VLNKVTYRMDAILKHLLHVTGHRDRQLLEKSILSAICQMAGVQYARILLIAESNGRTVVRPEAWIENGKINLASLAGDKEQDEEPISNYPTLLTCIENIRIYDVENLANGFRVWFPLWIDGKVVTCFEIHKKNPMSRKTNELIQGMLGVYGNFVSLLDYSERDSLTGLLNRKTFENHFSKVHIQSEAELSELSKLSDLSYPHQDRRHETGIKKQWLAVVDIDHFKHVNDTLGHLYGDEVLILIGQLMTASFRSQDRIFRFGGEEFVIMIYATTLENVCMIVERFRAMVEGHLFPQVGHITVSVGFTSFEPEESPVVTLGHADEALYYAKAHGRNMVCYYDELVMQGLLPDSSRIENAAIEYF
jgi:diguanylate cyclase (GGDEF)-like protein